MHAKMPMPTTLLAEIRSAKCRTIATYSSFAEAKSALDYLLDHGFHEQSLAIVLKELPHREATIQESNWLLSSGQTAMNGAVIGLGISFLALMASMLTPTYQASIDLAFSGVAYGTLVGGVIGVLTWGSSSQHCTQSAATELARQRYNVMAQSNDAGRAQEVLSSLMQPQLEFDPSLS